MRSLRVLICVAAVGWLTSCVPKSAERTVGLLNFSPRLSGCAELQETHLAELGAKRNWQLKFVHRDAGGDRELLSSLASELVAEGVDVLLTSSTPAAVAAKRAAETGGVPVVFTLVSDPIGAGLVDRLPVSSTGVTGVVDYGVILAAKRLELLLLADPSIRRVLVPLTDSSTARAVWSELEIAAEKLEIEVQPLRVESGGRVGARIR